MSREHTRWFQVVVILSVGGSVDSTLPVIDYRHFHKECSYGKFLNLCFYFFSIGCYEFVVGA
jgi:hypothetical protein